MSGAKTLAGPRPAIPAVPATVRFGRVGAVHQREADLIAETAEPLVAKTYAPPSSNDGVVLRSSNPAPSFARAVSSAGSSLAPRTRRHFQERLGHDFGEVRIHADQDAAAAVDTMFARAFTRNRHIFFAAGEYHPSTPGSRVGSRQAPMRRPIVRRSPRRSIESWRDED